MHLVCESILEPRSEAVDMSNHVHRVRWLGLDTASISAYWQADDLARYEQGTSGQPMFVLRYWGLNP